MTLRPTVLFFAASGLCFAGCGDDAGGSGQPACTTTVLPGDDDTTAVLTALIEAEPGDVLCFDGSYAFDGALSLTVDGITLQGVGPERAVWDFSGLTDSGAEGFRADNVQGITISNLSVKNTPGDGIRIQNGTDVVIRNTSVEWDGEPRGENGAYGFYPVLCTNVLIEDSYVYGASDAGVYVGQSTNVIVRNSVAEGNVAGIEIENCVDSIVYGNEAFDNTGGLIIFDLPGLTMQGLRTLAYDNDLHDNNRPNFASQGKVRTIPAGTGALIRVMDEVELRDNTFRNNVSGAVLLISEDTVCEVRGEGEACYPEDFNPYPVKVFVHDNTYTNNGNDPQESAALIAALLFDGTIADIFWDGFVEDGNGPSDVLCIQEDASVTFGNGNGLTSGDRDRAPFDCTFPPLDMSAVEAAVGQQ